MFGRIARRYDLLNRVLSLGQDVRWRPRVAARVAEAPPGRLLDVCTGTGDVALDLTSARARCTAATSACRCWRGLGARARSSTAAVLVRRRRAPPAARRRRAWTRSPSPSASATSRTSSGGLRELARVLRPGGALAGARVLDAARDRSPPLLRWWARTCRPASADWLSGDGEAYRYLPDSVASFPDGDELRRRLEAAGFAGVRVHPLTGGVATLYDGERAGDGRRC